MVLATVFVSLPLVVRELVPVLEEEGLEQEQAAQSLGANACQRFRRITLPTIRWALAYGVVLSLARASGSTARCWSCPATSRADPDGDPADRQPVRAISSRRLPGVVLLITVTVTVASSP